MSLPTHVLSLLSLFLLAFLAKASQSQPPATATEIDRLVQQLASPQFRERATASKRLQAIGKPALKALQQAKESKDPEVRQRVEALIPLIDPSLEPIFRQRAIETLGKLHVGVRVKKDARGVDCYHVLFRSDSKSDESLGLLRGLSNIHSLELSDNKELTNKGLAHLRELTSLLELQLQFTTITDDGLQCLESLTNLEELNLYKDQVTDNGLRHLQGLTKLQTLSLVRVSHIFRALFPRQPCLDGWLPQRVQLMNRRSGCVSRRG